MVYRVESFGGVRRMRPAERGFILLPYWLLFWWAGFAMLIDPECRRYGKLWFAVIP